MIVADFSTVMIKSERWSVANDDKNEVSAYLMDNAEHDIMMSQEGKCTKSELVKEANEFAKEHKADLNGDLKGVFTIQSAENKRYLANHWEETHPELREQEDGNIQEKPKFHWNIIRTHTGYAFKCDKDDGENGQGAYLRMDQKQKEYPVFSKEFETAKKGTSWTILKVKSENETSENQWMIRNVKTDYSMCKSTYRRSWLGRKIYYPTMKFPKETLEMTDMHWIITKVKK